ncbi:MAG TPA: ATPase, T2SS/T4P/T4SS family, partial [Candidatus Paceibacterota bacterium]
VGEIRDLETAKIAINAALTGHFVLSTLHTNNAAGAIPRLIDLGENPAAMAPAINAVIAQRLVRTLCSCKTEARADDKERKIINNVLASLPEAYKKEIKFREGMALWRPNGCEKCNMLGYKGRIGIYELIVIDEPMKRLIIKSPDETEIQRASKNQGFLDMRQDGVIKVLNGVTTLEELSRVVDL